MQVWNTPIQLSATMTNPEVRVSFGDGAFFTQAAMIVAAATTIVAAHCSRCAARPCQCRFRRPGFDQRKRFFVHVVLLLSRPLAHIQSLIATAQSAVASCFPRGALRSYVAPLSTTPTRQNCCSILNKSEKNSWRTPQEGTTTDSCRSGYLRRLKPQQYPIPAKMTVNNETVG